MAQFEIADCIVDLAGDKGNQVPKYGVTASEIQVLRAIHGEEAVHTIEPKGFVENQHQNERRRLMEYYGKIGEDKCPVRTLFPGNAPRMIERIVDLELPEEFFKAITRVAPAVAAEQPVDADKEPAPEATETDAEEDDGIRDMDPPPKPEKKHRTVKPKDGDIFS